MRKLVTVLTAVILTACVFAQPPEKMSYQATIRNSSNQLVTNHTVNMKISILQGSAIGTAVYVETQSKSTDANGLVTIEIGGGTIFSGTFSGIDWSAGPYFLKTETDPTGGTSFTITGTSQLLSVPYALYSKSTTNGFASVYSETDPRPVLNDNGNIGIGASPNWAKLDVNGQLNIGPGQNTWGSQILINAASLKKGKEYKLTSTSGQGKLYFGCTGKGDVMVMDSNLYVGIGTGNPTSKLDVNGAINVNNNKITNVANPVNINDAANKAYVDSKTHIHYVGESYGGGIVFYVHDNGQHGLIAATTDQNAGIQWYNGTYRYTGTTGDGLYAGAMNTAIIVATQMADNPTGSFAAKVCADYSVTIGDDTYGDWYLPSKYELNLLYLQKNVVGGFSSAYSYYWSSTEVNSQIACGQYFGWVGNNQGTYGKSSTVHVRAVRAF